MKSNGADIKWVFNDYLAYRDKKHRDSLNYSSSYLADDEIVNLLKELITLRFKQDNNLPVEMLISQASNLS